MKKTVDIVKKVHFFLFMMDGSTDISGDEQDAVNLRLSIDRKVVKRFLALGTPRSICSQNLKDFVLNMFGNLGIDRGISIYYYICRI